MPFSNYANLRKTYTNCDCDYCSGYMKFKSQNKCPAQTNNDIVENYGSFSLSAAIRYPWNFSCGQFEKIYSDVPGI